MAHANTFERWMIWGLVGLLVLSALPINIVLAQEIAPVFAGGASARILDNGDIRVEWGYAGGTPVTRVEVYYSKDDSTVALQYATSAGVATNDNMGLHVIPRSSFTLGSTGATYYFKVGAMNSVNTTYSSVGSLFIPSAQAAAPGAPMNFSVNQGQTGQELNLTWAAPSGTVTRYEVKLRSSETKSPVTDLNWNELCGWPDCYSYSSGTSLSLIATGLTAGRLYYFGLRACNDTGCSSTVQGSGTTIIPSPMPPTDLRSTSQTETTAILQWMVPVNPGTRYVLKYKEGATAGTPEEWAGTTWTTVLASLMPSASSAAQTYTVTGLLSGRTYTFGLRAYGDATDAYFSAIAQSAPVTTASTTVPPPSTETPLPSVALAGPVTETTIPLSVVMPANMGSGYSVNIKYKIGEIFTEINDWGSATLLNATPIIAAAVPTAMNLTKGTKYTFGIKATNTNGSAFTMITFVTAGSATIPPGTAGLRVTVRDYTGAFVQGATVGLERSGGPSISSPTSATGFIEFTSLPAGLYTLGIAPSGRTDLAPSANNAVTLIENSVVSREFTLLQGTTNPPPVGTDIPVGTANVVGSVHAALLSTQPALGIANIEVQLLRTDGKYRRVTTDTQGYYKFSLIEGGDYTLFVYGEDQLGYKQAPDVKKVLAAAETWTVPSFYLIKDATTPPPVTKMQCADGIDNDGDGLIDYPKDPSCFGPEDNDEYYPPPAPAAAPAIHRLEPAYAKIGTTVKITGANFHATDNWVRFGVGGFPKAVSDGTTLTFTVPQYMDPCPAIAIGVPVCMAVAQPVEPGKAYPVVVTTPSGASSSFQFAVTLSDIVPPDDQCLPSANEAEWYCAQNSVGDPITLHGECFLKKMLVWHPNLKYTKGKCTGEPPPLPPGVTGIVKGRVTVRDPLTGVEFGSQTKVYLRPQLIYTFGSTTTQTSAGYTIATSNDGYYSIALQPGSYFVSADPPTSSHEPIHDFPVVTIAASEVKIQNIYFRKVEVAPVPTKGGTLTGTVTDYNDRPLAGVDIWVTALSGPPTLNLIRPQRTNEQGMYLVTSMIPGKYRIGVTVPLSRDDLLMPQPAEVAIAASIKVVQDFRFEKRKEQGIGLPSGDAYVKGIVKDANGGAFAGAIVQLKRFDGTGFSYMHTDPYGTYVFPNIAGGAYRIGVYPPPLKPHYQSIEEDLDVPSGQVTVKEFTMLAREGVVPPPIEKGVGSIRGRVLFRDGVNEYPMRTNVFLGQYARGAGARQSQTTAEDGAFIFMNLVPGTYDLSAGLPSHAADAAAIARDINFYKITIAANEERTQDVIFKRGRIPPPIQRPGEDIEQQYQELRRILIERQQMLKNMTVELQKKGGAEQELRAIAEQLQLMIAKADGARKGDDMETLRSLFGELQTLERTIGETIERLFRTAGNSEFVDRVKSILSDAPKYIKEMSNAIAKREKSGADVAVLETQLDEVESLRAKAQELFNAGRVERANGEEGAGDLAFAMLDRGQTLYCALDLGGKQGCAVKFTGPVRTPVYIKTTLGKNAEKDYTAFMKNVATDSTSQFALEAILPELSPERMRAMFAIQKGASSIMQPIVRNLGHYDADDRAKILETNVSVHTEVQGLREAQDALAEVRGISKSARQTVDGLRKTLEKFVFPLGVGELAHTLLEAFNTSIVNEQITNPRILEGYVRTFNTTMNAYLREAVQEKYEAGLIPAKNIQETHSLFAAALALRERDALEVILNAKGNVALKQRIAGKVMVDFVEKAASDEDALTASLERRLMKAKTVTGQDVMLLIVDAYDLDVASRIQRNRAQFAAYMSRELGEKITTRQLAQPVTTRQAIEYLGAAVEKFGAAEETQ